MEDENAAFRDSRHQPAVGRGGFLRRGGFNPSDFNWERDYRRVNGRGGRNVRTSNNVGSTHYGRSGYQGRRNNWPRYSHRETPNIGQRNWSTGANVGWYTNSRGGDFRRNRHSRVEDRQGSPNVSNDSNTNTLVCDSASRFDARVDQIFNNALFTPSSSITSDYEQNFIESDGTQRERLTEALKQGTCDCVICFEHIRQEDRIWSCCNCYHVFHLICVKKWAFASQRSEGDWRCPGCQNAIHTKPSRYFCFCGKQENPKWNKHEAWLIPHSCGEQCLNSKRQKQCSHPCTLLCHPGPCPPCLVYIDVHCYCGQIKQKKKCSEDEEFSCGNVCDKTLNCGKHKCRRTCHPEDKHVCDEKILISCFCGRNQKEVQCGDNSYDELTNYSCEIACARPLECGYHNCDRPCHADTCGVCKFSPELVKTCPCGKTTFTSMTNFQPRIACTDPIPVCDLVCGKALSCGPTDSRHKCSANCHIGACPPCNLTTMMKCSCGSRYEDINCSEMIPGLIVKCKKRCNKKKSCGRHRCNQTCCTDNQHKCDLICSQKLSCNQHRCDRVCHLGNCSPCQNTSFDELTCHCGATVLYPPIPCGTEPPECYELCQRTRNCEHPSQHKCHSEAECPPCTVLTSKWCYGGHELRTCIPCFQTDVCCGHPCGRLLPCGRHNCPRRCHADLCSESDVPCVLPCSKPRSECGHPCNLPCHDDTCLPSVCKAMVTVTCRCGRRTAQVSCVENVSIYNRLSALTVSSGKQNEEKLQRTRTLDCDGECALLERNRKVALALQIRNPDLTNKLRPPAYSDFLKDQAKKSPELVSEIYQQLTNLVQNAKESKQKSRSHAFPAMKSDHRRIIHELAEYFGCETQSYDQEPKKNVVATAFKEKSWLPSASLISVIEKESVGSNSRAAGRAPPPVPHCSTRKD